MYMVAALRNGRKDRSRPLSSAGCLPSQLYPFSIFVSKFPPSYKDIGQVDWGHPGEPHFNSTAPVQTLSSDQVIL